MAKVILGMTISLDGFVNDRNGSVQALYPDLADWRETTVGKESIENTGAVVMGRNSYGMSEDPDWFAGNYEYQVPIFVTGEDSGNGTAGWQDRFEIPFCKVIKLDWRSHVISGLLGQYRKKNRKNPKAIHCGS